MNDIYLMQIALDEAQIALGNGEFPVGCVIAEREKVIATGARRSSFGKATNELEHAEINALHQLSENDSPSSTAGLTIYCTMEPCLMCFSAIILSGITKVVYAYEDVMGGGTGINLNHLPPLYRNHTITVVPHIMRTESLTLFKRFFKNRQNQYWKNSLLESYTLSQ